MGVDDIQGGSQHPKIVVRFRIEIRIRPKRVFSQPCIGSVRVLEIAVNFEVKSLVLTQPETCLERAVHLVKRVIFSKAVSVFIEELDIRQDIFCPRASQF